MMNRLILIVDDDPMARQLLSIYLRDPAFSIIEASNGQKALEKVKDKKPDLVILDIMMPGMSGYDVCRALRKDWETAVLPIILYSAKTHPRDVKEGMEAGANEYLTKLTPRKEMLATIHRLLAE